MCCRRTQTSLALLNDPFDRLSQPQLLKTTSLAEGLLLDGVYDPPIVTQDVYIALRSDSSTGAGTAENPFRGNTAAEFDAVMRKVCKNDALTLQSINTTVHLGPGEFQTVGGNTGSTANGFVLCNTVRVTGAGRDVTRLKLTGPFGGNVFAAPFLTPLTGVEIDNLCIDCGRMGAAIQISGQNILIRDLRIVQFGPDEDVYNRIIVRLADSASGRIARNCIIERVAFDDSGGYATDASVILVQLDAASQLEAHQFCVVRQCFFNAEPITPPGSPPLVYPAIGILTRSGRGFIAEENQMLKVTTGIKQEDATIDSIFWNNEFDVVQYGIDISHDATSPAVGRVIMIENAINLARTTAVGIQVVGETTERNFKDIIVRKNVIAADPNSGGSTSSLAGIKVFNTTNAIVENNVINDCENGTTGPLEYGECDKFKAFNNQDRTGTLLRAYNSTSGASRYLMELQDFTEDALLGL
jgi:hypothetical protein